MGDGTNPLDPTQSHKHALQLIDRDALQSAFDSATKAEHDRKQGDKAARDKSAAFFTSPPRRAPPTVPVAPPASDAQTPAPLPPTLSDDQARALLAELNQKLALHGIRLPPAPTPPAPPAHLSSEQELALRIAAEQQLQSGMRSGSWSPAERKAHEAQLAAMKHEADETSPDPEVQKRARYEDLASLGHAQVCSSLDTVDSLTARRDAILGARDTKERSDEERRIQMGLDGKTGTPEQLALYEAGQRYDTYPKSGTGVILVGIASARGASTEELRAAGVRGDMLEGLGGGVGHLVLAGRPPRQDYDWRRASADRATEEERPIPPASPGTNVRPASHSEASSERLAPESVGAAVPGPAANLTAAPSVGAARATHPEAVAVVGDAEASFATDAHGLTVRARGVVEGPHPGRGKRYVPDPAGGRAPGDHRGHLIAEGGARTPSKVNVRPNIISEAPSSNLGPKKRFDLLAAKIAAANPGRQVETEHDPIREPGSARPIAVRHRILIDGSEVHDETIENK